jgi:hypothetical protein
LGRHKKAIPTDRTAYQQAYYLERKAEIAARKQRRFQEDADYRAIIAVASLASKARMRAARDEARARARAARGGLTEREVARIAGVAGGAAPWAAQVVGVNVLTLRRWVRIGAVPPTGRAHGAHTLYSEAQAVGIAAAWALYRDRYGVPGKPAKVVEARGDARRLRALVARQWAAVGELVEG